MNKDARELLDELTMDALLVCKDKMKDGDDKTQLAAAREILDRTLPSKKEVTSNGGPIFNIDFSKLIDGVHKIREIKADE